MPEIRINNHFTTVDGRRMHYRQAGTGPVVVMLHAAPCSAKVMEPVQRVFATEFSTIAVDLPGFGLSDPMAKDDMLRTEDLADAIKRLLDVLGIGQAAFYGRHTGAGVAVEFAHRHPDRCSMVLTDGFPVFAVPYSEERLDEYLGSITPTPHGEHLLWVWYRYRDLFTFWPWDKRTAAARADAAIPPVDALHRGALELLESGNEFRRVYGSAFRHAGLKMIHGVKPPVCFGLRPGDSQFKTKALYPADAWVQEFPREEAKASPKELEILRTHPAKGRYEQGGSDFGRGSVIPDVGYIEFGERQTLVRSSGVGRSGAPILVLHDLPGSSAVHLDLIAEMGRHGPVFAIDFLGQGQSLAASVDEISIAAWSRQLSEAATTLGLDRFDILAIGTSAAVALEFATREPQRVASLVLQSPPAFDADVRAGLAGKYAVSAAPEWDGTHLTRVFHHLREQQLWWPWFERTNLNVRKNEPDIDPDRLTLRVRECVKQPHFYKPVWDMVLAYPLLERLSAAKNARIVRADADVFREFADNAARAVGGSAIADMPQAAADQAKLLRGLLA